MILAFILLGVLAAWIVHTACHRFIEHVMLKRCLLLCFDGTAFVWFAWIVIYSVATAKADQWEMNFHAIRSASYTAGVSFIYLLFTCFRSIRS